jgi:ubiquinone/menaquinone biosynthesis C-methylase UbiE
MSSERQLLEKKSPWWGEHVHRYDVAVKRLKGNEKILDIACGTGFGSDILAQYTKNTVIGGDIVPEVVAECRETWHRPNLKFEVLDGTKLPYEDGYFDVIVSYETIEHTTQYVEMLNEFNRVLKPNGTAFISTPNFPINSPSGKVTNPYHTQEFTYDELDKILRGAFKNVDITGQEYSRYRNASFGKNMASVIETVLLQRGIRKIPMSWQDGLMKGLIGKQLYPDVEDYTMVSDKNALMHCKTFFAICKKY